MWTKWMAQLCVPLASAAVLAGCTQEVKDDSAQKRMEYGEPRKMEVAVTGCLGAGTGTNHYMLTHVRPLPLASQPSDALSSANMTIPHDSAMRLSTRNEDQLTSLVGQTVTVTGLLRDEGHNSIGTSGRPAAENQPAPPTDQSQAAAGQHPELTVERVKATGQKCTHD